MPVAVITGASKGFGRALAAALAARRWKLIVNARGSDELENARAALAASTDVIAIPGDVADAGHRAAVADAVRSAGGLDLLANNASELGPSPLPQLREYAIDDLDAVFGVNVLAPLALVQLLLPTLEAREGTVVNVSSDAAVEAYPGWGGYGASKAALDQLTSVLAAEVPTIRAYAFDPGDMRTVMHQRAYPGEDISDRPPPESVVPALLRLLDERPASGRYRAADLLAAALAG
ncbi:MAG: SDR family NAD(P)-dependent oxidoreductase [Candidatus Dormibacteria bacterium]